MYMYATVLRGISGSSIKMAARLKFSANLSFLFKEKSFLERYACAARAGFVGVECGVDLYQFSKEELRRAKREASVQQVLLNAPVAQGEGHPGKWGLAAVPGLEDAFRDSVATALEYAGALECQRVHFMAGTRPAGEGQEELCRRTFVSNLRFAASECGKHSVTALIEPISVIPYYFLKYQGQAREVIDEVSSPNLQLLMDLFHAQRADGNITQHLTDNMAVIGHLQVAQVPGRHEPSAEGELNYRYILRETSRLGYNGWIGCEYVPTATGSVADTLRWMESHKI